MTARAIHATTSAGLSFTGGFVGMGGVSSGGEAGLRPKLDFAANYTIPQDFVTKIDGGRATAADRPPRSMT